VKKKRNLEKKEEEINGDELKIEGKGKRKSAKKEKKNIKPKKLKKKSSSTEIVAKESKIPLSFDEGIKNEEIKKKFYDFLVKTISNEYLDFYNDIENFQNTPFENEDDIKKAIDQICSNYLGIGEENKGVVISFNFDALQDFQEKLLKNSLKNIFSSLFSEAKVILKNQYHVFKKDSDKTT